MQAQRFFSTTHAATNGLTLPVNGNDNGRRLEDEMWLEVGGSNVAIESHNDANSSDDHQNEAGGITTTTSLSTDGGPTSQLPVKPVLSTLTAAEQPPTSPTVHTTARSPLSQLSQSW